MQRPRGLRGRRVLVLPGLQRGELRQRHLHQSGLRVPERVELQPRHGGMRRRGPRGRRADRGGEAHLPDHHLQRRQGRGGCVHGRLRRAGERGRGMRGGNRIVPVRLRRRRRGSQRRLRRRQRGQCRQRGVRGRVQCAAEFQRRHRQLRHAHARAAHHHGGHAVQAPLLRRGADLLRLHHRPLHGRQRVLPHRERQPALPLRTRAHGGGGEAEGARFARGIRPRDDQGGGVRAALLRRGEGVHGLHDRPLQRVRVVHDGGGQQQPHQDRLLRPRARGGVPRGGRG
mmetsp:Transcript_1139/g.4650  ORF Transcript_1139/g.4650 Transcript_1139/m.4650 type:complete len:285 (+) Transcript_1139:2205-3059(+)